MMPAILRAGMGLKPQHFDAALLARNSGLWFEVHPENYWVDGGPRRRWLERIRGAHPIALHGVSLSLASADGVDPVALCQLASLVQQFEPAIVSEHLAWSSWDGTYFPDLLPFPRTTEALLCIERNIDRVQHRLKRRIAIENPSHYLHLPGHEWSEESFLAELVRRTGCGLLLDVNNVFVSASNLGYSAEAYLDAIAAEAVMEIHLAGHTPDPLHGAALLIDSHDAPIAQPVWALYQRLIDRIGPRPTLIERDGEIPAFDTLLEECATAQCVLDACGADDATQPVRSLETA